MPAINGHTRIPSTVAREEGVLMDELIANPPGWLLRFGIAMIFLVVVIGLILSWIIKYPDKVEASLILTSENPPIELVPNLAAPLDSLLYEDQEMVRSGELVAVMESTADWQDVERLTQWLKTVEALPDILSFSRLSPATDLEIGELQIPYARLLQEIRELQYFLMQNLTAYKIEAIQAEVQQLDQLNRSLAIQEGIFGEELQLMQIDLERSRLLNQSKSLSDKTLEAAKVHFLGQKRLLEGMRSGIIQNEIRRQQLESQQMELRENRKQDLDLRYVAIQQNIGRLAEAIETWEKKHCLFAPISGRITYSVGLADKQFIPAGMTVATVIPLSGRGRVIGRAYVPTFGVGRIELADEMRIRLDAYPDTEHGILKAKVDKIAPLPYKDEDGNIFHLMEANLPDTLVTTYHKVIPFNQKINGRATIITKERRLLERLFENILSSLQTDNI